MVSSGFSIGKTCFGPPDLIDIVYDYLFLKQNKRQNKHTVKTPYNTLDINLSPVDLRSICVSFSHPLVWTCDVLHWLWSSSNSYASRRKFVTVWPPNASRHNLIASQLYMREMYDFLRLASRLANRLATHRTSVRKFWFCKLALTCESVWPGL